MGLMYSALSWMLVCSFSSDVSGRNVPLASAYESRGQRPYTLSPTTPYRVH